MELKFVQTITTDVLVIGGGSAGLRAAIAARKHGLDVVLVSESPAGFRNNTSISAAGFTASGIAKSSGDSPEAHFEDTITSGCFINDRKIAAAMASGATQQVYDLMGFGVKFRQQSGELVVLPGAGHRYPRIVYTEVPLGLYLTRPMRQFAAGAGVKFEEGILVTKLFRDGEGAVGALGIDNKGRALAFNARSTILASGGGGDIYLRSDNAIGSTGDGYVLAYEAGATLRDMEFVQFYPTVWGKNGRKFCDFETFIPEGATVRNSSGEDILKRHGVSDFNNVTRDILSRVIMEEVAAGRGIEGHVVFDFTTIPPKRIQELFAASPMGKEGYLEKVLVAPTTHFFMGGVKINEHAEAGISGLFAAGEVSGGAHGANRLTGNALTETFVFGAIAGERAAAHAATADRCPIPQKGITTEIERLLEMASGKTQGNLEQLRQAIKQTMWEKVGIIRDKKSLEGALEEILAFREQLKTTSCSTSQQLYQGVKLANMLAVAEMVCCAALTRTESRGAHYRTDYSQENEQWLKTIEISRQNSKMVLKLTPIL